MIWLIAFLALVAIILIVIGARAMNVPGQSADMRVGGTYPVLLGIGLLAIDIALLMVWLIVQAVTR